MLNMNISYQYPSRSPMLGLRFFSARWRNWHTRERTWWMDLIRMSLMVVYGDIRCYLISWIYHSNWQLVSFDLLCFFLVICWLMIFVRLRWYTQCLWCKKDIDIALYHSWCHNICRYGFIMFIYDTSIVQSGTSCTHRSLYWNRLFWVQHSKLRWCYMHLCCSMLA